MTALDPEDKQKRIDLNLMARVVNKSIYEPEMDKW